jgi:hypothetical protein
MLLLLLVNTAGANEKEGVWFYPSPGSQDYMGLFSEPAQWHRARSRVNVFGFATDQVSDGGRKTLNGLDQLASGHAFAKLKSWGLRVAVTAPALKEWDCGSQTEVKITLGLVENVTANGGSVDFIDFDEPLVSALGRNKPICNLSVDSAALNVARYATQFAASVREKGYAPVQFVDTEAYPALSIAEIEQFIAATAKAGLKLAELHLDINFDMLRLKQSLADKFPQDLKEIASYMRRQGVPLGVIIWSGHDPERSDKDYFEHSMDALRMVRRTNANVDDWIFSSWVTRCSSVRGCAMPNFGCQANDGPSCGHVSIPRNLPEMGVAYSHSRLILDATSLSHANP